jgi:pimeloyl-ACP methyl ester carboxylesterase
MSGQRWLSLPGVSWASLGGALLLLAGCTSAGGPNAADADPLASFYGQQLTWASCGGSFDCTKVTVPLDYAAPQGRSIQLALTRLKSKLAHRSLVLNPGGPGVSGVDLARQAYEELSSDLVLAYNVVGFDPRGVGASDPVQCLSGPQADAFLGTDSTPHTAAQVAAISAVSAGIGAGCAKGSPDTAAHMGTADAARDMDIIRAALGDDTLNYLGFSYGTDLGAQYADLFPTRVGRMVLDGALPGSLTIEQVWGQQGDGFDASLRRFVADCLPRQDCPLTGSTEAGIRRIATFLAGLDTHPLPAGKGRVLTEGLATPSIYYLLYEPAHGWPYLRSSLASAFAGDGSALVSSVDSFYGRQPDGTYKDNLLPAMYAVECTDTPEIGGPEHIAVLAREWKKTAPVFGESQAWGMLPCWHWSPARTTTPAPAPFRARGSAPLLVVSGLHDPATPYQWGVQVAKELDNATLLTYSGDGHTAYHRGSTCIDTAVDSYLIRGTMPAKGTQCAPD